MNKKFKEEGDVTRVVKLKKVSLEDVHKKFGQWFGESYDLDMIDAVCATAAVNQLDGDPVWLLIVSGPGWTKTETVQTLLGAGAHVTSTIISEGALLSATTPKGKRSQATATGGLLRKIGDRGILVLKDFTSILSMGDRNIRGAVLAALREIFDGRWERNVGSEGGQTLTWTGSLIVIGAVTTAWDEAHSVISLMGDRFVLLRVDFEKDRERVARQAILNSGREGRMRQELADVVGGLLGNITNKNDLTLSEEEQGKLIYTADLVTLARTAVERDYKGDVTNVHGFEAPTRFVKQLIQLVRGSIAIGMSRERAMRLAVRCARDTIPPLRLKILFDLQLKGPSRANWVRQRINRPLPTVQRELVALNLIGLVKSEEITTTEADGSEAERRPIVTYQLHDLDCDGGLRLQMLKWMGAIDRPYEKRDAL